MRHWNAKRAVRDTNGQQFSLEFDAIAQEMQETEERRTQSAPEPAPVMSGERNKALFYPKLRRSGEQAPEANQSGALLCAALRIMPGVTFAMQYCERPELRDLIGACADAELRFIIEYARDLQLMLQAIMADREIVRAQSCRQPGVERVPLSLFDPPPCLVTLSQLPTELQEDAVPSA